VIECCRERTVINQQARRNRAASLKQILVAVGSADVTVWSRERCSSMLVQEWGTTGKKFYAVLVDFLVQSCR
jgi:hypothetical protein